MSEARLTPAIEVDGLLRLTREFGGFGTVLRKGDPGRGSIILMISDRGVHAKCLERRLDLDGQYRWMTTGPEAGCAPSTLSEWTKKRANFDEDVWLIELDVPLPERLIVEIGAVG